MSHPLNCFRGIAAALCAALLISGTAVRAADTAPDEAAIQFFEAKIRPILTERCYSCHSATAKKLKGELYVDGREALLKGGETGAAIVPGHPEQSRLIEAISYKNVDLQMPPKDKLPDGQVADLTAWIKMGAPWPKESGGKASTARGGFDLKQRKAAHWAWQPITVVPPGPVKNAAWPKGEVDRYILAAMESKGLAPAGDVDRRSLLRRAYFDLIGLPPSAKQIEVFLADQSPDAFAKVVDELLASPHFGERWARHWMDLARYAETYGHEFDYPMAHAFQYRDYLIRAFNADVPYDQFVTEQVAGDLLEKPRLHPTEKFNESIIGTGFWWFTEQVQAPVDVRQNQADRIDNQVDTLGKTFLGLTLGCARCHDHKFDAISTKDVYSLWGFVESSRRQDALLDPGNRIQASAGQLAEAVKEGSAALLRAAPVDQSERAAYFTHCLQNSPESAWQLTDASRAASVKGKQDISSIGDASRRVSHPMFTWTAMKSADAQHFAEHRRKIAAKLAAEAAAAREAIASTVLFKDFQDGNYNGWYVTGEAFGGRPTKVGEWDAASPSFRVVEQASAHSGQLASRLKGVLRSPDFTIEHDTILYRASGHGVIRLIIDGFRMDEFNHLLFAGCELKVNQNRLGWIQQTKDVDRYIGHRAHIEMIDDDDLSLAVEQIRFADRKARLSDEPSAMAMELAADEQITSLDALAAAYGKKCSAAMDRWKSGVTTSEEAMLVNCALDLQWVAPGDTSLAALDAVKRRMEAINAALPEPIRVIAMADGDGVVEHVYIRGSHKTPGEVAPRQFLEAIAGADQADVGKHCGRLELARRMVDHSDPLLPRVMVNRIWHHLFGRGIVASTDNFGVLGSAPSHKELLDYLSDWFVHEGWSVKKAIRQMMLSRTYQLASSGADGHAEEVDPQNLLLHRANMRRLEGEAIRDAMLMISGRLDDTMFGPSINAHLTSFMSGRGLPADGPLDGAGRRSIYTAVRRNFLPPMMLAFDTPTPFSTMGRRSVSNVPAQALILMNDPFVVQEAGLWARRELKQGNLSPEARIKQMYVAAFARDASAKEIAAGLAFMRQQATALGLAADQSLTDERVWTDYAHVLLNLKEFVFLN
jgi:hypothetical protein